MRTREIVYSPSTRRFYINELKWDSKESSKIVKAGFLGLFHKEIKIKECWHVEKNISSTIYWDEALESYNNCPKTEKETLYNYINKNRIDLFILATDYKRSSRGIEVLSTDNRWYVVETGVGNVLNDFIEKIEQEKRETVLAGDDDIYGVPIDIKKLRLLMDSDFERPVPLKADFINEKVRELSEAPESVVETERLIEFPIGINVFTGEKQRVSFDNIIFSGGTGSGKSNLSRWLIECTKGNAEILILDGKRVDYAKYLGENGIKVYSADEICEFCSEIKIRMESRIKSYIKNKKCNERPFILVMDDIDDMLFDDKLNKVVHDMLTQGKNTGMGAVIVTSRIMDKVPQNIRRYVDVAVGTASLDWNYSELPSEAKAVKLSKHEFILPEESVVEKYVVFKAPDII